MLRIALLAVVTLGSVGCGEIQIPITRTKTFVIETQTEPCGVYEVSESLDTEDARPYLARVDLVEVREVKLAITNPATLTDSVATVMSGSLQVAAPESADFLTLVEHTEVPVVEGEILPLPAINADGAALVSDLVVAPPHALKLRAQGCFDQAPAGVELTATITYVLRGNLF